MKRRAAQRAKLRRNRACHGQKPTLHRRRLKLKTGQKR